MKIGLVLDDGLDSTDGVQQYVLHVGAWLTEQGHDVHYLVGETRRTDIPNMHSLSRNIHVRFNGNRMSVPLPTSGRRLKQLLNTQQFDVLHVQAVYSPYLAGRLIKHASPTTAVIGTFHILPNSSLATWGNRLLAILNYRSGMRFDSILAVSAPAKKFAAKIYGYETQVVPNPINVPRFMSAKSESPLVSIVFLGRLVERKGARYLLEAVAYIRKRGMVNEPFRVLIGGKGELFLSLKHFVDANGLGDMVSFVGFVDEADKPAFLAQSDIAVYPSTGGESFGIVLLEAMAASRGVVLAGNNPGYSSVMAPYPDQLFNPVDIQSFAERLAWFLTHRAARERASELQHGYVEHFDIQVVGQQIVNVYKAALQKRRQT